MSMAMSSETIDHAAEAERLLAWVNSKTANGTSYGTYLDRAIAKAQVHATLALVEVTWATRRTTR